jgi:hypothetical protein
MKKKMGLQKENNYDLLIRDIELNEVFDRIKASTFQFGFYTIKIKKEDFYSDILFLTDVLLNDKIVLGDLDSVKDLLFRRRNRYSLITTTAIIITSSSLSSTCVQNVLNFNRTISKYIIIVLS